MFYELPYIILLENECENCTKNIERLHGVLVVLNMEFNLVLRRPQVKVVKLKGY